MRRTMMALGLVAGMVALGSCDETTEPDVSERFEATLNGANEVPARTTAATGTAVFELNRAGTELNYTLTATNLQNFTMAHIHAGAADVNGPIVVYLFGPHGGSGVSVSPVTKTGTIRAADVNPANFTGTFADFLDDLRDGGMYVNAHTVTYPGGEIRGQVELDP